MVAFALGSDTGGSIRIPAAYCGCTGHKPTYGIVSRYGCMALGNSLDHMGPLTVTPRDAALVMDAIAGYDSRDDSSLPTPAGDFWTDNFSLRGIRAGIPQNFFTERLSPDVSAAFQSVLERAKSAGAELKPVRVPDPEALNVIARVILMSEVSALMEPYAHRRDEFGPDVIALIDQGRLLSATDYVNAQRLRRRWQREWTKLWKDIDILLAPTAPIVAPKIGQTTVSWNEGASGQSAEEDVRLATTRLVRSINVLGLPAASVPLPVSGLPIGLQIIGPPFADNLVLSVGSCFI
jgi:aspartyl-tRNA(Asn)/glutamyl-tRNA(Gln) amidotransferase subunit A